jgi:hypothetical protein
MITKTILDDTRAIRYICLSGGDICVDADDPHVSKIIPYPETGERAYVTWYAVYDESDEVLMRVNGAYVALLEYYP